MYPFICIDALFVFRGHSWKLGIDSRREGQGDGGPTSHTVPGNNMLDQLPLTSPSCILHRILPSVLMLSLLCADTGGSLALYSGLGVFMQPVINLNSHILPIRWIFWTQSKCRVLGYQMNANSNCAKGQSLEYSTRKAGDCVEALPRSMALWAVAPHINKA
ncbi:hypothetical protein J6590_077510 [Homalodisca vitripennis]|nr:hypothetical protein J6590_077510 [Homalodisca vitripennis]